MDRESVKIKKPPILFEDTQKLIAEIEELIESTLLVYWNSPNGAVCSNDVLALYEILDQMGAKEKIGFFIKSDGGNGESSLRMVNLLRQYMGHVTALLPLDCASAATMIALGADEIHMGPLAYLTAVDTSLRHELSPVNKNNNLVSVSQDELTRVIKLWDLEAKDHDKNPYEELYSYVHPLVIGAIDRSSSLSIKLCKEILSYHMEDEAAAEQISTQLNSNYPSHSYPITLREAEDMGLAVKKIEPRLNDLLLDLNQLYSEMGQRALTDYDEQNYHNNEILNILEGNGAQIFYQNDKDWHYRKEERRWVPMNDLSAWYKMAMVDGEVKQTEFHIR